MKCGEAKQLRSADLDGELSEEQKKQLQEHLEHCIDCRLEAEQLAEISNLLSRIPQVPLPSGFSSRLHEALAEEGKAIRQEKEAAVIVPIGTGKIEKKRRRTVFIGLAAAFMVGFVSLAMYNDIIPLMQRDMGTKQFDVSNDTADGAASSTAGDGGDSCQTSVGAVDAAKQDQPQAAGAKAEAAPSPQKEERIELFGKDKTVQRWNSADTTDDPAVHEEETGLPMPAMLSAPMEDMAESAPSVASGGKEEGLTLPDSAGEYWRSAAPENYVPSRNGTIKSAKEVQATLSQKADLMVSAINDRDLTAMKSLIKYGGKTDHIDDRAAVALNYYAIFFGGETVSAQQISGEDSNSHATYRLSNESGVSLDISLTAEARRITLNEGIIAYGYDVDQALAGTNYTLISYTARNAAGQIEFKVRIDVDRDGNSGSQLVTFLCENGRVTRQEDALQ